MGGFLVACWIFGFSFWDWQQEFFIMGWGGCGFWWEEWRRKREEEMDRESDDFEERGERVMVFFLFCWMRIMVSEQRWSLTFEREKTLVNRQYKLKLTMCISHDTRTSVTGDIDCCHLILFAVIPHTSVQEILVHIYKS